MFTNGDRYSIDTHHHQFAGWAAARAAQRGLAGGTHALLLRAINECGVIEVARAGASRNHWTAASFDEAHDKWSRAVLKTLHSRGAKTASYGRAAKLIAIYLKSAVVLAGRHATSLGKIAHPPIDEILLRALAADAAFSTECRRLWRTTRWTSLDRAGYAAVIASFRSEGLDQPAFWTIERYWKA